MKTFKLFLLLIFLVINISEAELIRSVQDTLLLGPIIFSDSGGIYVVPDSLQVLVKWSGSDIHTSTWTRTVLKVNYKDSTWIDSVLYTAGGTATTLSNRYYFKKLFDDVDGGEPYGPYTVNIRAFGDFGIFFDNNWNIIKVPKSIFTFYADIDSFHVAMGYDPNTYSKTRYWNDADTTFIVANTDIPGNDTLWALIYPHTGAWPGARPTGNIVLKRYH